MDLDELCRSEGLDPEALDDTVQWARARADELVAGLVADAELGPILDAMWEHESGLHRLPPPPAHDDPAMREPVAAPAAEVRAEAAVPEPAPRIHTEPALNGPATAPELPQPTPEASEPMTLRGMLAEGARPAVGLPPLPTSPTSEPLKEMTQEIDAEEIEMLDEDELELLDDDGGSEGEADASDGSSDDDVPEWQQALHSAALGGGAQADHDSGLLRLQRAAPEEPAPSEESSVDVDVSDI